MQPILIFRVHSIAFTLFDNTIGLNTNIGFTQLDKLHPIVKAHPIVKLHPIVKTHPIVKLHVPSKWHTYHFFRR